MYRSVSAEEEQGAILWVGQKSEILSRLSAGGHALRYALKSCLAHLLPCAATRLLVSILVTLLIGSMSLRSEAAVNLQRFDCRSVAPQALPIPPEAFSSLSNSELHERARLVETVEGRAAARVLAERYERGTAIKQDLAKAIEYYEKAAFVFPVARSVYVPGFGGTSGSAVMADDGGPITPGDVIAMSRLARMYRSGIGLERDADVAAALGSCAARYANAAAAPYEPKPVASAEGAPTPRAAPQAEPAMLNNELKTFSVSSNITGISWSPDGRFIAVSHDLDRSIELFEAGTGRKLWDFRRAHGGSAPSKYVLEFSGDSSILYLAAPVDTEHGQEAVVVGLSTKDGREVRALKYLAPVQGAASALAVAVDSKNKKLLAIPQGNSSSIISFSDTTSTASVVYQEAREYLGPGRSFSAARLAVDSSRDRGFWSHGGSLHVLSLPDWRPVREIQAFNLEVQALKVDPATGDAVVGGSANVVNERYPLTGPLQEEREYKDDPAALVRAFDPQSGKLTRTFLGPGGTVYGVAVSPDGKWIAAAKARMVGKVSSHVLLWNSRTQDLVSSKDYGQSSVGGVAFAPTGSLLAYASGSSVHVARISEKTKKIGGENP